MWCLVWFIGANLHLNAQNPYIGKTFIKTKPNCLKPWYSSNQLWISYIWMGNHPFKGVGGGGGGGSEVKMRFLVILKENFMYFHLLYRIEKYSTVFCILTKMWESVGVISECIRNDFERFLIDYVHKTQKYGHFSTFWVLQLTWTNWWAILEGKHKDLCPVSPLIDQFWQVISVSSTTEVASWWFFAPKKWISSLCRGTPWLCQKNFFC